MDLVRHTHPARTLGICPGEGGRVGAKVAIEVQQNSVPSS
jgi:hypothetical protein